VLWTIVNRAVDVVFLVLALVILILFYSNSQKENVEDYTLKQLEIYKIENRKVMENHLYYLENKINRVAESSDGYQVSSATRIDVLEKKVKELEKSNKQQNKIINNNISSATINGVPQEPAQ